MKRLNRDHGDNRPVEDVSASFVARFWLEQDNQDPPEWRGHIKHVQSGREEYFSALASMQAFLKTVTGIPIPNLRTKKKPSPTE